MVLPLKTSATPALLFASAVPAVTFTNLTGATEIGANCYQIKVGERRVILDAGMHPRREGEAALPQLQLVPDHSAEAIVAVASPLLLLLGWVGSGRSVVLPARSENS